MSGKLICISGLDGSGKTTQSILIENYLKEMNIGCERVAPFNFRYLEPIVKSNKYRRKIINFIKEYNVPSNQFNEAFVACYALDMIETIIMPRIMEEKVVITDRYFESSLLNLYLLELDSLWVDKIITKIFNPYLWIFIDVMPELCHKRIKDRGMPINNTYESISGLTRQREFYLSKQKDFNFKIVDGNKPCEEVFNSIKCLLAKL